MKNINNSEFEHQDADALLKKAISLWKKDGFYDDENEKSQFYDIAKDPIVRLFMIALAHQTNNIKDEISWFKENLLEEFIEKIIPYHLVKPIPAFSIIQTSKEESIENDCFTNSETPFILEKENLKIGGSGNEKDKFQFIPLLKTKVIRAQIFSIQKIEQNKFNVIMMCNEPVSDLCGVSFYFTTKTFTDLSISINGKSLPLIKPGDYENIPFTEWFDMENVIFDQSLIYGTKEFWLDVFVANNIQYFIVDKYDSKRLSLGYDNRIEMIFEFTTPDLRFNFDENDLKINCVPIVNVEKQSISLSNDEPFRKIATEKNSDKNKNNKEDRIDSVSQKQLLNLMAPSQLNYDRNDFTMRRFGMERFNRNELILQINSILNKYSSDYYAFMDSEGLKDGDKIKNLNYALKEVVDELKKHENPSYGIYLILNKNNSLSESKNSMEINYLLTDGSRANGINTFSTIVTPIQFDAKASQLLMETSGGKDMEMNNELKNNIAQYYFLTKDRLITKSDIRSFCYKELSFRFSINRESIEKVDIRNEFKITSQEKSRFILVEIRLNESKSHLYKDGFENIEMQLKKMIEIRSANLFPVQVKMI
jgi:hypothetical protein